MTRDEAIEAIHGEGYDLLRRSGDGDGESLYVAILDPGGEDPDATHALERLRSVLPGLDVEWTGDGNTDCDGTSYSDVSITGFSEEATACREWDRGAPHARQTR